MSGLILTPWMALTRVGKPGPVRLMSQSAIYNALSCLEIYGQTVLPQQNLFSPLPSAMDSVEPNELPHWFAAYPPPTNLQSKTVTREDLRQWILKGEGKGQDFIIVDVRRDDHQVTNAD